MNLKKLTPLLSIVMTLQAMTTTAQEYRLLIGTYTTGKSEGIYVYDFDPSTGGMVYRNKATGVENPSYLAVTDDRRQVFAVNESGDGKGAVSAFSYDPGTGGLQFLNKVPSGGDHPCYVETDRNRRHVFAANYSGGSLAVFPVRKDGSLAPATQIIQHSGSGPDRQRQEKAHVHMTILSPDEKYLVTNDLGTDRVTVYRYDPAAAAPLKEFSDYQAAPGAGPRHLAFHPAGKTAYLLNELSGDITVLSFSDGSFTLLQNVSPVKGRSKTDAADIRISPDGRFLYASYRGELNELAIYAINEKDGRVTFAGRQATGGTGPRNFVIDPSGRYLLVAHQRSHDIRVFSRDQATGALTPLPEKTVAVDSPVCLLFVKAG